MTFEKVVVIDGRGHLMGRLASTVAKELLMGQRVVVVRAEGVEISGSLFRNKLKFNDFLNKKMVTNPKKHGPFHEHSPAKMLRRVIRGMLPRKTEKGAIALLKLKVFEGIPAPYDKMKRVVIPDALRVLRLKPARNFTVLGALCHNVGWKHSELIKTLEERRKLKSKKFYETKKAAIVAKAKAEKEIKLPAEVAATLAKYGN